MDHSTLTFLPSGFLLDLVLCPFMTTRYSNTILALLAPTNLVVIVASTISSPQDPHYLLLPTLLKIVPTLNSLHNSS